MTLARVHRLTIRIDRAGTNYPEVRLLVDGDDLLARDGHDRGNDPADILDTGHSCRPIPLVGSPSIGAGTLSSGVTSGTSPAFTFALPVPEGAPDRLASRLLALLDDGLEPERIERDRLWR